ncbi:MAG: STAS domain-containing protein [Desulfovibrio sp.]|jgi:anti-sigma B factor antagonist|nr:STAS domain-containing protein [Desulfovibrio sp.]
MFALESNVYKKVTVLRLTGDVLIEDVQEFTNQLEAWLLAPRVREVALDLSRVGSMDHAGLGVLVSASTKSRSRGCRLVLLAPAPHVKQLLQQVGIEEFFPMYESEDEMQGHLNMTTA